MIKHFSLFSGIESFKKALTNLGIDNELVGYSEFVNSELYDFCTSFQAILIKGE